MTLARRRCNAIRRNDKYGYALYRLPTNRILLLVAIAFIIAMSAILLGASRADAPSWRTGSASLGCNGVVNSADSISHGVWHSSTLSSAMASATSWARTNVIDPTDINTFTVTSVAVDTDGTVYDQDDTTFCGYSWHGSGGLVVLGRAMCVSLATNPANACEKHEVRFDESYTGPATTTQRRHIACHEMGHTLGLTHPPQNSGSCMYADPNSTTLTFSAADITNINLFYNEDGR